MGLARELATNPFLRADEEDIRNRWGGTSAPETFARFMELTNQLLPPPEPHGATERYTGCESFSRLAPSALTAPSDAATIANNE